MSLKVKSESLTSFVNSVVGYEYTLHIIHVSYVSESFSTKFLVYQLKMLRGLYVSRICLKNAFRVPFYKSRFSTLGNPMFPQRAEPDIDSILDKADKKGSKDKNAKATPDILSDHGGKIALVAFGLAIALFYSYYVGGQNKNKIEEEVTQLSNIEPYEMHEMRYLNNLTTEQYTEVVQHCKNHFSSGFCTYSDFVNFVTSKTILKGIKLQRCHLLDRFLQSYIAQTMNVTHRCIDNESRKALVFQPGWTTDHSDPQAEIVFQEVPVSVDLLLVGLNMFMLEDANSRIEGLFRIAEINCSGSTGSNNNTNNNSSFGDVVDSPASGGGDDAAAIAAAVENGQIITTRKCRPRRSLNRIEIAFLFMSIVHFIFVSVTAESAVDLIRLLIETDQVPAEKQVIENGVKYPFKQYQRKDAQQMVRFVCI